MLERPDFPLVWDNSMRTSFVSCPRKFAWEYLHHFKPKAPNVHLHAGKAWASALEATRKSYYVDEFPSNHAQALGLETLIREYGTFEPGRGAENKSLDSLMRAFAYYFQAFPLETDPVQPFIGPDGPMIEFSFALPLDETLRHPETNEPIIYTGRADMIATYAGALSVYDDKTTSSLGSKWGDQWTRRSQFSAYTWAARAFDIPVTQIVVRGIALLKTETKHAQAISTRTDHHIREWHFQMVRDIRRAMECWSSGYWDADLSDSCSSYGSCLFLGPCTSSDPEPWLTGGNYAIRKWNPLTREESESENAS
jgi:hypothetical protein